MRHHVPPQIRRSRVAVQEDDRVAVAFVQIGHRDAVDVRELLRRVWRIRQHCSSPPPSDGYRRPSRIRQATRPLLRPTHGGVWRRRAPPPPFQATYGKRSRTNQTGSAKQLRGPVMRPSLSTTSITLIAHALASSVTCSVPG